MTDYRLIADSYDQAVERDAKGMPTKVARHKHGSVFSVTDDDEAARLIRAGAIVPANLDDEDDEDEAALMAQLEAEAAQAAKAATDAGLDDNAEVNVKIVELKRPSKNAVRDEWVAYALAKGADESLIGEVSKADLIDAYGDE